MADKEITCIICPISCRITVGESKKDNGRIHVSGAECSRGIKYARSEISDPRRIFTSTVRVDAGDPGLVPVRTDNPIKRQRWQQAAATVKKLEVKAPVGFNEVVEKDFTEEGISLISTRQIGKAR